MPREGGSRFSATRRRFWLGARTAIRNTCSPVFAWRSRMLRSTLRAFVQHHERRPLLLLRPRLLAERVLPEEVILEIHRFIALIPAQRPPLRAGGGRVLLIIG